MTKLTVKRYSILCSIPGTDFHSNSMREIKNMVKSCAYYYKTFPRNYVIRDNHAEIEKLAEKAKNN